MTETNQEENSFNAISAKEQQKRDSIMNELYNEISSSDDEDEDNSTANSDKMATSAAASSNPAEKSQSAAAQNSSSAAEISDGSAGAGGDLANPFKRQVSAQASEALKELYGDDSEDSAGEDEILSFEVHQEDRGDQRQKQ